MGRLVARVRGEVQGVGFRVFVAEEARRLGLSGFVRNRGDGSVEVVAEGHEAPLRALEVLLRRGPPAAAVAHVEVEWQEGVGEQNGFRIRG
jgi:acylphosphatase